MSDCDYQGYEFGACYLDSVCIDGFLWDADSGHESDGGWIYTNGGERPCPKCSHDSWLTDVAESVSEEGWLAGYQGESIESCPHPKTDEQFKYHEESDAAVFRFVWLDGYAHGIAEKRSETVEDT